MEVAESNGLPSQQGPSKKARQFAPDQPLKSVVFELFSQQQYWTVKDLKAAAVSGGATEAGTCLFYTSSGARDPCAPRVVFSSCHTTT